MMIYPAIDLRKGNCVRLFRGDFDKETFYSNDPIKTAFYYANLGATFLHVVDLDGAKEGYSVQNELIIRIKNESKINIQAGGGIRDKNAIEKLLNHGISRVVLGSIAINQALLVRKWLDQYGPEKIVLAFDVKLNEKGDPILTTQGWTNLRNKILWNVLDFYHTSHGIKHVLCTDIERDGTLEGPNTTLYKTCSSRYPEIAFQASGGIKSLEDLKTLNQISIAGTIIGKALYEKKFSLSDAMNIFEVEKC